MKESLDRHLLAPKKRESFRLSAVADVSGFAASHALDASGKAIRPPTTLLFLAPLPVCFAKPEALQVDPPPQEYPHLEEAGRERHQGWENWPPRKTYVMEVREALHSFHPHLPKQKTWGYDGVLPGPTIVAYEGEPIMVRDVNLLQQDVNSFGSPEVSTHLHNAHAASESDGFAGNYISPTKAGPTLARPGKFYDCHYPNCYAAYDKWTSTYGDWREGLGTLWYHDHREHFTAANVYIDEVRRKLGFYDTDPAADPDIANHTGALRLGKVGRDRWLMMPNKTAAAQVVRAIDNMI